MTRTAPARISSVRVRAFTVPAEAPESDGTLLWNAATLVLCEITAGEVVGSGYTYADPAAAQLARTLLVPIVEGADPTDHGALFARMIAAVRNVGYGGVASLAISALDTALWDLRARLLGVPLVALFGATREAVPVYGSGGFTSLAPKALREQLGGWAAAGTRAVKMKVGRDPDADVDRVHEARRAVGPDVHLFVDANGAYARKQALRLAAEFAKLDVRWFEEPVDHLDLEGLRLVRDRAPATMEISAGEYGFDLPYFARMLDAGAVDVLQADATRCCGFSGFLAVDGLAQTKLMPLSTHCAPTLHAHVACAAKRVRHVEWFADHVRIERLMFDGFLEPDRGMLRPDRTRVGHGLTVHENAAHPYLVDGA